MTISLLSGVFACACELPTQLPLRGGLHRNEGGFAETTGCGGRLGVAGAAGATDLNIGCGDGDLGGVETQLQQFRWVLVMAPSPNSTIIADIPVELPRPRMDDADDSQDERKAELRHQLLGLLQH